MKTKSQAALEFLMTYGWAILVVLVAVGALAYFGVLSPDKFLPSKCLLQAGMGCVDYKATRTQVTAVIQNSLGYDISSIVVGIGSCGTSSSTASLTNGAKATYTITCAGTDWDLIKDGSKFSNQQVNVSYLITETGLTHINQGSMTTKFE